VGPFQQANQRARADLPVGPTGDLGQHFRAAIGAFRATRLPARCLFQGLIPPTPLLRG
jgi:hypothetical protein